jgi:hypothetical protein
MKGRANFRFAVLVIIAKLLFTAAANAETVDLRLKLTEGQTFKLMLTTVNNGSVTFKNQAVNTAETAKVGMVFNVERVEADGSMQIKVTFDNSTYTASTAGQPGGEQLMTAVSKAFSALNGRSFKIEVTQSGVVRNLTGLDAATREALQSLAGQPEAIRTLAEMLFAQSMSEPIWKHAMSSIFSIIPDHPVAIGERWSRQFAFSSSDGGQQGIIYYKIIERSNGISKIKMYSEIKSAERMVGPSIKLAFTGVAEGMAEIDEAMGLVVRAYSTANLKGKATEIAGKNGSIGSLTMRSSSSIERY